MTHVSCLTPAGAGAIAVIAVRGPRAWDVLRDLFRPASGPIPAEGLPTGSVRFGRLGDAATADEVVLAVADRWLELHTHGGRQVVDWLIELLASRGAKPISFTEFVARDEPPDRAEAWRQLAHAPTVRTAAILLDQVHGAFERALADIRAGTRSADDILPFAALGRHLVEPWRVAVAGPPNVGKSSLVNALAGYQRSVVAPIAGTTRDVVSTTIALDGWPVELLDTAGLREAAAGLEGAGIDRAREALRSADLVLWLMDATDPAPAACGFAGALSVANKCDLPVSREVEADLRISARTGEGIPALCALLSRKLVPQPPPPGAAVPISAAQVAELNRLRGA